MKLNKSTEQAVFVLLMLALQKDHRPVRSSTLAQVLDVSDSYLKKILKTMVDKGLIEAMAGREGGYNLARPITSYTMADAFEAMESFDSPLLSESLARAVYEPSEHLEASIATVQETYQNAAQAYIAQLRKLPLSRLVAKEALDNGILDWAEEARKR